MSPPYCPETNIRESGTRFSYISFWAEFRVQKLIYENRVPDYRIFVSGRSFLPPFYFSWGEALGSFGEAVWEASGKLLGGPLSQHSNTSFEKGPTFDHPLSQHSNTSFEKSLKKV